MVVNPLVSVITPCYNYGKFLSETLENLLQQTYQNWECLIINDGSIDDTEEIALKYVQLDTRFRYYYQQNKGLSAARNAALLQVKGKYIQLLDADDLLETEKLSLQVALMETKPNIDLVYSGILIFSTNAKKREYTNFILNNDIKVSGKNQTVVSALIEDNFFLPGCVIFRKTLYEQVGNFNEGLYGLEDWNYWFRAALLGFEFLYDDRAGTRLLSRNHDNNMSKVYHKMLKARISARADVMKISRELKNNNKLLLNTSYFNTIMLQHDKYLAADMSSYHLYYGNFLLGLKNTFLHAFYSGKPFHAFTNAIRWTYLRVKGYKV